MFTRSVECLITRGILNLFAEGFKAENYVVACAKVAHFSAADGLDDILLVIASVRSRPLLHAVAIVVAGHAATRPPAKKPFSHSTTRPIRIL